MLKITCLSIDCPERKGGECKYKNDPYSDVFNFLRESNAIENAWDIDSLIDALQAWEYLILVIKEAEKWEYYKWFQ